MIPMCRKCRFQKRIHQEIHRQDLTQVDRNLITIRELNYLLSDRMFARRRFKNEKEQLLRALLGDDEGWGFAWFYMSMLYSTISNIFWEDHYPYP